MPMNLPIDSLLWPEYALEQRILTVSLFSLLFLRFATLFTLSIGILHQMKLRDKIKKLYSWQQFENTSLVNSKNLFTCNFLNIIDRRILDANFKGLLERGIFFP
jgi:hypothetical protein